MEKIKISLLKIENEFIELEAMLIDYPEYYQNDLKEVKHDREKC